MAQTPQPAVTGLLFGTWKRQRPRQRALQCPVRLAETEGFEPSMQVLARMLP